MRTHCNRLVTAERNLLVSLGRRSVVNLSDPASVVNGEATSITCVCGGSLGISVACCTGTRVASPTA
jgi:hypothetical protein